MSEPPTSITPGLRQSTTPASRRSPSRSASPKPNHNHTADPLDEKMKDSMHMTVTQLGTCCFSVANGDEVVASCGDAVISRAEATPAVIEMIRLAYAAGLKRGADLAATAAVEATMRAVDCKKIGAGLAAKVQIEDFSGHASPTGR